MNAAEARARTAAVVQQKLDAERAERERKATAREKAQRQAEEMLPEKMIEVLAKIDEKVEAGLSRCVINGFGVVVDGEEVSMLPLYEMRLKEMGYRVIRQRGAVRYSDDTAEVEVEDLEVTW